MITMKSKDAIAGAEAECYVTIDGTRYNFMQAIKFEAKYEKTKTEVPILGRRNKGNKAVGGKGSGTMTVHYNQTIFREMLEKYQNSAEDTYFDMEVSNEDKTSAVGRQTILFQNCNIDGGIIAKFDAGAEYLDEEVAFTFENFIIKNKFNNLEGII
ncbi:MAG: phage tail tube protein [Fusobacterium sp.]|jgi:hypothetical protein|nr:phage tail tube protein [Fusobacterium sp.]DAV76404.1 MAG TPA: tail tube protein [Caudoviricetes sp.]